MQILRSEICSIFPRERVAFEPKTPEELFVTQWFKDRAVQVTGEIDFAIGAVIEPKTEAMSGNVFGAGNVEDHLLIPMGQSR